MTRLQLLAVVTLSTLFVTTACERTPEDLEQWRTAKGGMDKMRQWAQSPDEPRPVRIRAVEILVEDGQVNALQPTLDNIDDAELRADMIGAAMPVIESKWSEQDMPTLSEEAKAQGGRIRAGESETVEAKDAAYFLQPFATGEHKQRLERLLAEWMSTDWQLRNQLGRATLGQIAPRASDDGFDHLVAWLQEAVQPHTVAAMVDKHGGDEAKKQAAITLRERAEEAHPELDSSLETAVLTFEHSELTPYLQQAATDPDSSDDLIDGVMDALVRIEGEDAAPFFGKLVENEQGLLRWVAATRMIEVMGKPGFAYVANALPAEADAYAGGDDQGLRDDTEYFCKMYRGEMNDAGVATVSDQLRRGLESDDWPAQVLALQCARIFAADDLEDAISPLASERRRIPGWGEDKSVGELSGEVLEQLSET